MAEAVEDAFRYGKLVLATITYNADIFPFMKTYIDHLTEDVYKRQAYTYAPAGKISIFDYSHIIFATLLGFFLFGEIPDHYSFIGYGLIILASLGMFVHNMKVIKCR